VSHSTNATTRAAATTIRARLLMTSKRLGDLFGRKKKLLSLIPNVWQVSAGQGQPLYNVEKLLVQIRLVQIQNN